MSDLEHRIKENLEPILELPDPGSESARTTTCLTRSSDTTLRMSSPCASR